MIGRSPGRVTALLLSRIDSPASRSGVDARQAPQGRRSEGRPSSAALAFEDADHLSLILHTQSHQTALQRGVLGGCSSRDRGASRRSGSLLLRHRSAPQGGSHSPRCLGSTAPTGCRHRFCGEVTGDVATLEAIWVRAGYSAPQPVAGDIEEGLGVLRAAAGAGKLSDAVEDAKLLASSSSDGGLPLVSGPRLRRATQSRLKGSCRRL